MRAILNIILNGDFLGVAIDDDDEARYYYTLNNSYASCLVLGTQAQAESATTIAGLKLKKYAPM